jgi:hypothetical protein
VVLEVEVRVVLPHRAAEAERDEAQLLAEARNEMESRGDMVDERVVVRLRTLEDRGRGDMHVSAVSLEMKEGSVES